MSAPPQKNCPPQYNPAQYCPQSVTCCCSKPTTPQMKAPVIQTKTNKLPPSISNFGLPAHPSFEYQSNCDQPLSDTRYALPEDSLDEESLKKNIICYAHCRASEMTLHQQEEERIRREQQLEVTQNLPKLRNRWTTEQRERFVYFVPQKLNINSCCYHQMCHPNDMMSFQQFVPTPECPFQTGMPFPGPQQQMMAQQAQMQQQQYPQQMQMQMQSQPLQTQQQQSDDPTTPKTKKMTRPQSSQGMKSPKPAAKKNLTFNAEENNETNADGSKLESKGPNFSGHQIVKREMNKDFSSPQEFKSESNQRAPFCNYGWNNQNPIKDDDYMKTWNVGPGDATQVYPFIVPRREKTHSYDGWKPFIQYEQKKEPSKYEFGQKARADGIDVASLKPLGSKKGNDENVDQDNFAQPQQDNVLGSPSNNKKKNMNLSASQQIPQQRGQLVQNAMPQQQQTSTPFFQMPQQQQQAQMQQQPGYQPQNYQMQQQMNQMPMQGGYDPIETPCGTAYFTPQCPFNSSFDNFEPNRLSELNPQNYRHLPHTYTDFIRPAGKRTAHSFTSKDCFFQID